ncbi:60S ribosomal protein L22 1 [Phytophthora cinnamomi]|uniref:60S ribosomal protein L22 1 n=1 Tax=Phytophthora cinnamomi TaxID=4785 RepID=UPI003559EFD0|nr:60S ribosomal protein L22 1 [Phytophthora cinnamomi]
MASPTNTTVSSLHSTIRSRLDTLKQQCHKVCGDVSDGHARKSSTSTGTTAPHPRHEFFSSVQLWKERSLHRTLESLDKAGSPSVDSHMEAIEDHERAAEHLFDLTRVFLDRTWQDTDALLDAFADDLAGLVDDIVAARLEEQRIIHANVVKGMKEENQRLAKAYQELKGVNGDLEARLEVFENTPNAGGDAIMCNKLRSRLHQLVVNHHQLSVDLEEAAEERVKHRRELDRVKTQLLDVQKALALTRAMHDKETRQLAAMLQLSHAQVHQVLEASPRNSTEATRFFSVQHFSSTIKLSGPRNVTKKT